MTTYLIKLVVCSGVLILVYFLFLEKEKIHRYNRCYLLFAFILSLVAPLISIQWTEEKTVLAAPVYVMNEIWEVTESKTSTSSVVGDHEHFFSPILAAYLLVTVLLFIRFVRNLASLWFQIQRNERQVDQGTKLVLVNGLPLPYSFFNYVFVDKEQWQTGKLKREILQHELTHVKQKHTYDNLLIELLLVLVWFNPFFYLYKRAVRLNHEYLADNGVIQCFQNIKSYQHLLLNTATNTCHVNLTSTFNYLITKKRILMMLKKTSPVNAAARQAGTIICMLTVVFLISTDIIAQQTQKTTEKKPDSSQKKETDKATIWLAKPIGFTKEGVSQELLNEYDALVNKYFNDTDDHPGEKFETVSETDRARMEEIFKQMSLDQQNRQKLAFLKPPKPLPKQVPSKEQFEKFKNPRVFGIWIDDKKVPNSALNNFANTDFSHVFISKLRGAAKKGRTYTHQVDLMTNDHYKQYFEQTIKNKRSNMAYRSLIKKKNTRNK